MVIWGYLAFFLCRVIAVIDGSFGGSTWLFRVIHRGCIPVVYLVTLPISACQPSAFLKEDSGP